MLKDIRKSKKTPAPHTDEEPSDATKAFLDQWLEHLCEERPDLAAAISKPLIMKSALDSAFDTGIYCLDEDGIIGKLEQLEDARSSKGKDQTKISKQKTKESKSRKGKGRGKHKGLKKPHTDI